MGQKVKAVKVEAEKMEFEKVEGEKVEGAKGKTSTEKGCNTHPEKDWELKRPLLVKTSVRKKSAGHAWNTFG